MKKTIGLLIASSSLFSCTPQTKQEAPVIPAVEYARKVGGGQVPGFDRNPTLSEPFRSFSVSKNGQLEPIAMQPQDSRAQLRMVKDLPPEERVQYYKRPEQVVSNLSEVPDVEIYRSNRPNTLDYQGPLTVGDPGVTASLWRASRRGNDLFNDDRAWQPYDLITITIAENSQGMKEADTEVRTNSSLLAAIENFFGYENDVVSSNPELSLSNLINATTTSDFIGEGETTRRGTLTARISAMVVEVLPGGVLRIEGEKIISMNKEEQVLVISGLVRPRDINSLNEVDSSKVAQLRIDFYGNGVLAGAQNGGWFSNLFRRFWPF